MTKEQLRSYYDGAFLVESDKQFEQVLDFARVLLLECAKAVCINCKEGNLSERTKDPSRRVHRTTATYHESCRATAFFIEGE